MCTSIDMICLIGCRLMQGWLFVNDEDFWQPVQAEALLTSVPLVRYFWLLIFVWVTPHTCYHPFTDLINMH